MAGKKRLYSEAVIGHAEQAVKGESPFKPFDVNNQICLNRIKRLRNHEFESLNLTPLARIQSMFMRSRSKTE